jgi:hypothetical protein
MIQFALSKFGTNYDYHGSQKTLLKLLLAIKIWQNAGETCDSGFAYGARKGIDFWKHKNRIGNAEEEINYSDGGQSAQGAGPPAKIY